MKYREILTEIFNQPYAWEVSENNHTPGYLPSWSATFRTDQGRYGVDILASTMLEPDAVSLDFSIFEPYHRDRWKINGMGDAFRIMATVTEIAKKYCEKYKPLVVEFMSSEESRTKLYLQMAKSIPEYTLSTETHGTETEFTLKRREGL